MNSLFKFPSEYSKHSAISLINDEMIPKCFKSQASQINLLNVLLNLQRQFITRDD